MTRDRIDSRVGRRAFLNRAVKIGGLAGLTALAGCSGNQGGNGSSGNQGGNDSSGNQGGNDSSGNQGGNDSSGDQDSNSKLPQYTYLNNPQSYSAVRHDAINLIGKQMNEAGFNVKVKTMEWGSLFSKVTKAHNYDLATWWTGFNVDPGIFLSLRFSSSNMKEGGLNYTGYSNKKIDKKLNEQISIADEKKRADVMHDIQKTLMKDVPMMPILQMPDLAIYNKDQTGNWKMQPGFGPNSLWTMAHVNVENDKKQLVGAWPESVKTLNRLSSSANKVTYQTTLLYDKLVQLDADLKPSKKLSLATDWQRLNDKKVQYTIRDHHKWHDGKPVTADDVAFTYNYIKENQAPSLTTQTKFIDKAKATDRKTVELDFTQKIGPIHKVIESRVPIIPKHKWQNRKNPIQANINKPIGSGPMKFDHWDKSSELGLKKYKEHFYDMPINERIWRIIPQKSTQWNLLKNGKVHYLPFAGISRQLNENQDNPHIGVKKEIGTSFWHLSQNNRRKGLDQRVVRQAAVNTIPRTAIAKQIMYGFPEPGSNLVSKAYGDLHTDNVPDYKESVKAAKKRLKKANSVK